MNNFIAFIIAAFIVCLLAMSAGHLPSDFLELAWIEIRYFIVQFFYAGSGAFQMLFLVGLIWLVFSRKRRYY